MAALMIGLAMTVGGCGLADAVDPPQPTLPGAMDELPGGVVVGASWGRGEAALPEGVRLTDRFATADEAFLALTEPFGRRPMPPRGPGIEGRTLAATDDELQLLVTYPVFGDSRAWGEQVLLVVRHDHTGWGAHQAWMRRLCTDAADGPVCAEG